MHYVESRNLIPRRVPTDQNIADAGTKWLKVNKWTLFYECIQGTGSRHPVKNVIAALAHTVRSHSQEQRSSPPATPATATTAVVVAGLGRRSRSLARATVVGECKLVITIIGIDCDAL